jgi:2-polyprenyl-6-hydroxyphenyl methylase/3-demethylubiquinone-9 3-methyltransferase
MTRPLAREELVHEAMGDSFAQALSLYDTNRRVQVLVDEFLPDSAIAGKTALDVGCGLGFFSRRLVERGADVTGCDIGLGLVERTRRSAGCDGVVADALDLTGRFGPNSFDLVVSSECIEHTPDPVRVISEMLAVLRPGGYLSLSTPNRVWSPVVRFASRVGLRPFDGLENFSTWADVRAAIAAGGATIVKEQGLHLFPFQLPLHRLSSFCDERLQSLRGLMINICVLARKHVGSA